MEKITTGGLDLAKSVFQVHGIADEEGTVIVRRALRRSQVLDFFRSALLGLGNPGPVAYGSADATGVKAYLKRNKTDATDAEAICEAVTRPTMRNVP